MVFRLFDVGVVTTFTYPLSECDLWEKLAEIILSDSLDTNVYMYSCLAGVHLLIELNPTNGLWFQYGIPPCLYILAFYNTLTQLTFHPF